MKRVIIFKQSVCVKFLGLHQQQDYLSTTIKKSTIVKNVILIDINDDHKREREPD